MATVKKIKKAQDGYKVNPMAEAILKRKAASDTTKMYNREEALASYSKLKSKPEGATKMVDAKSNPTKYGTVNKGDTTYMSKGDFEKKFVKKNKKGGTTSKAKDGNWIQKAVNPKHKGYCTPMTKATCTPKRKALAKTFKAMGRARKGK